MPISSPPPAFRFPVRVYWEDTDAGGVVFYANYLKFFERARTEWLRGFGFEQEILRTREGVMFIVSETAVRYLRPARLDDLLQVSVTIREARQASLQLAQQCWRSDPDGETLLAEGTIRIGCVDSGTFRPRRIPIFLLEALA
ncbi:tol-pal system-associated acyl-CoA thioesterase [Methylibium petroleiphilum]|uniref:tol-pal system-associated acyl-CoA thioesterase n=1 Tax=Methylibium petroleiphilum TaxID=105560 RepID=UPI001AD5FCD6|nr:tol-pal system-associated acyl-CoA thioesterase [Methylibium petroleiphilum]MBN9204785.1 tol-pal system-associated acyl-CoA thioesterase [Methylibium petroleiphilum]